MRRRAGGARDRSARHRARRLRPAGRQRARPARHDERDAIAVPIVVLTGHGSIELAAAAIKEGAEHFLTKPVELASLAVVIDRVIEHQQNTRRVKAERARPLDPIDELFAGKSVAARTLAREARAVAACDAPILIEGETGTGKGVLARRLHEAQRLAVNRWIRTQANFDAVIDFDRLMSGGPVHDGNASLKPGFACDGDLVHPNAAGYKAMGEFVGLGLFNPAKRSQ